MLAENLILFSGVVMLVSLICINIRNISLYLNHDFDIQQKTYEEELKKAYD